jgi:hypothetical protein
VTLYGTIGRSEFGLYLPEGDIRIECKWQSVSGSVDEKFPYLLECVKSMYEPTAVIIVDGGGAKPAAIEWLKKSAAAIQNKRILVVSISEFGTWMRNLKKGG